MNENTRYKHTLMEGQIETVEERDEEKSSHVSSKSWKGERMLTEVEDKERQHTNESLP
jgi:hypothetical protein